MTSSSMRIPNKIKVGFNNRADTYTGKLAYITYFDEKGVLRKESSWEGWRNKDIEPKEFTNEPIKGFVLNKGVGGARQSWGWNARNEYVRVYDPRGFEFEISVSNLLFILQETSSIKGKGLEGDFVYAWDGKELILLPTCCEEYVSCTEYTKKLSNKMHKSEIIAGCFYLFKNQSEAMYLGKHEVNEIKNSSGSFGMKKLGKKHVFIQKSKIGSQTTNSSQDYIFQTGYTNIAEKISDISNSFADEYEKLVCSAVTCDEVHFSYEKFDTSVLSKDSVYSTYVLSKIDDMYYPVIITNHHWDKSGTKFLYQESKIPLSINENSFSISNSRYFSSSGYWYESSRSYSEAKMSIEDLSNKDLYKIVISTNRGSKMGVNAHE